MTLPSRALAAAALLCLFILSAIGANAQTHSLQTATTTTPAPRISELDRTRLAEAFRIGDRLGERLWRGWSKAPFAVLLVTPEYEFLLRHPQPSKEFVSVGRDQLLGSEVFYRKRVFQPNLLATFPAVSGVSTIVIGQAENTDARTSTPWVVTVLHEHFHQLQDSQPNFYEEVNALDLAHGDQTGMWMLNYAFPYENVEIARRFKELGGALSDALAAENKEFDAKLKAYLAARRELQQRLAPADYRYFSFQLWKEGVARYTEYRIAELAARNYRPDKRFSSLADFTSFAQVAASILSRIKSELAEPRLERRQRVAFYALGAAEALLLDCAAHRWRERYLREKFFLEKFFRG